MGAIFGPFLVGQLADRTFSTERLLFVSHLVGAVLVWLLAEVERLKKANAELRAASGAAKRASAGGGADADSVDIDGTGKGAKARGKRKAPG